MSKLELEVLTPERTAVSREVDAVYLEGSDGRLGVLPGHTMLIAKLDFGVLEITAGGQKDELLCGDGLVEVNDDRVTVLVRSAESRTQIDRERAERSKERAKQRRDSKDPDIDMTRAETALYRAIKRIEFVEK